MNTPYFSACCTELKCEGEATLTEYATEIINMQKNPRSTNKAWKKVVMENTVGKLLATIESP